jgi:hypothetical protein
MDDVTNPPARPEPPVLMSTLEGVGSLLVIGGVLVCAASVASPGLASTLSHAAERSGAGPLR